MKHMIKNVDYGYRCVTCNQPEGNNSFTLSGILVHLGRVGVSLETIVEAKDWVKEHEDLVNKLHDLKLNKEVEVEI